MNVLPDVYICSDRKKSVPRLPERKSKLNLSGSIANSWTMLTKTNESGDIAKIRI